MPTASSQMIEKLAADGKVVTATLGKMKDYLDDAGDPPSKDAIEKLATQFAVFSPRIDKFAREIALKPPIFADEAAYELVRKLLTATMAGVAKTARVMAAEQAAAKLAVKVKVVSAAKSECLIKDKKMAQALKMVADGTKGRAGPADKDTKEYNHIHIGGNAKYNLLFQPGKKLVLGTLNFHLDSTCSDSQKKEIKKVAGRSGGTVTLVISGDEISEE
ncbi:MAG: hypothetical protein ABIV25_13165 [Paracoccaceae bacterium]